MKPKCSTGYLTPQLNRKKSLTKPKRSESSDDLLNFGQISEDVLKKLMSCPIKKQLIVNLITSEKHKIDAYKKKLENKTDFSKSSPLQKVLKKPCESPTALLRRRLEQQRNVSETRESISDSGSSSHSRPASRESMASTVPSPVSFDKILEEVIAFVEVKSGDRDRSDGVKAILKFMGATVRDKFTKDVTHVIFKDGSFTTYQKANLMKTKLVSVLWLEACKSSGIRVSEKDFPAIGAVGTNTYDHDQTVLCSQMQKDYEEIIREEFNKSIASGEPLPSVKSLIDRRRTLMMPNFSTIPQVDAQDDEIAKIMSRNMYSTHTPHMNLTPESPLDDKSDTGAIIDGDTSEIDYFNGILKNPSHQKTSTVPVDMDLTDLHGKAMVICSKENSYPNESISLYNNKTPKINNKSAVATSINYNSSLDLVENSLFKQNTEMFEDKSNGIDKYSATSLSGNEPKNTSNATPEKSNLDKFTSLTKNVEPKKSSHSISIDMVMSILEFSEKNISHSSSTAMSSLQISDASNKKNSNLHDSYKSTNNSFSPVEPNLINNLIEKLNEDISEETKNAKTKSRSSARKRNSNPKGDLNDTSLGVKALSETIQDLVLEAPKIIKGKNSKENITLRKKSLPKQIVDEDLEIESLFEDETPLKKNIDNSSKSCLEKLNENVPDNVEKSKFNVELRNSKHSGKNVSDKENTKCDTTILKPKHEKSENKLQHNKRKTNVSIINTLEADTVIKDKIPKKRLKITLLQKTNLDDSCKEESDLESPQNKENISVGLHNRRNTLAFVNKYNLKDQNIHPKWAKTDDSKKDSDIDSSQKIKTKASVIKRNKRYTFACSKRNVKNENLKKNRERYESDIDKSSQDESEEDSLHKNIEKYSHSLHNRRNTIACFTRDNLNDQCLQKTSSLNESKNFSDSDNRGKRKLRKLYDPNNSLKQTCSDNLERENKRRARKQRDSGVFVQPTIIFSKKAKEYAEINNLNIEEILNPSTEESSESGKKSRKNRGKQNAAKKKANSSDDEQVELRNWILNRKNKVQDNEQDKNELNSKQSLFQIPKVQKCHDADINIQSTSKKQKKNISQIRQSQRISKILNTPRTPRNASNSNVKLTPITPIRNRRSTMEFQSVTHSSIKKKLKIDKVKMPSIVCTKMHKEDVQVFNQIVKKLSRFKVEDEVSEKTTHLVVGEPKRTINMLRAIALGCWILKKEWLFRSLEFGKWLPEEDFEETDFSPAVQKNRLQRQAFGPSYTMDIFRDCGPIFISRSSIPRCSDLQELIYLCKGNVTKIARSATIVVGEYVKYEGTTCVKETWVLDSISSNKRLHFKKYIIKPDKRSILV